MNGDTETALVLIARDSSILTCFLTGGRVRLSEGIRVWLGLLTVAAAATNVSSFAASQDILLVATGALVSVVLVPADSLGYRSKYSLEKSAMVLIPNLPFTASASPAGSLVSYRAFSVTKWAQLRLSGAKLFFLDCRWRLCDAADLAV